jgi:chromosome segregation ATPase
MSLLTAERKINDITLENQRLDSDNGSLKALVRKLELDNAAKDSRLLTALDRNDRLATQLDEMTRVRENAASAEHEANQVREELDFLRAEKGDLTNELNLLKTTNLELEERNQQLASMHTASQEATKNLTDAARFVRAQNESKDHEIQELREKVTAAEADRDW